MVQRELREIMLKLVATFRFFFKFYIEGNTILNCPTLSVMRTCTRTCARVEGGGKVKLLEKMVAKKKRIKKKLRR